MGEMRWSDGILNQSLCSEEEESVDQEWMGEASQEAIAEVKVGKIVARIKGGGRWVMEKQISRENWQDLLRNSS